MQHSRIGYVILVIFRCLFTLLVIWTMWFIFRNALEPGALSSARSQEVTVALNHLISKLGAGPLTDAVVRKLAHFGEYLLLGFGYTLCLRVYTRHYIRHISWPLLLGLMVANLDETLQWVMVSGRNGNLKDVWLDFFGCFCGVLCALCVLLILSLFLSLLQSGRKTR